MRLDPFGNLGLGVTPSAWGVGYKAFQNGVFCLASDGTNNDLTANRFINSGGTSTYISNGFASMLRQDGGTFKFYTAPSGTAGNAITFTQAMTLDASGNLGIGTSSPGYKLDVFSGTASSAVAQFTGVNTGRGLKISTALVNSVNDAGVILDAQQASGVLMLATGGTERARIDSSGNLGIGTSSPAYKLDVDSTGGTVASLNSTNANGPGLRFARSGTANGYVGSAKYIVGGALADFGIDVSGANNLIFGTNDTERARIDASGNLGIGTSSPTAKLDVVGAMTFDGATLALKNTANLADNYNTVAFSSDFTPSATVDTNESGRVDFYNKSNNGTQQLGTSIQASAVATSALPTAVLGKLKLHAYFNASGTVQDTSYLELFANSTSTLAGNGGLFLRSGSAASSGKSLYFFIDDGETEAYRITSAGSSVWSPAGSEQMRLTSTGLGIGTSSPAYRLDAQTTATGTAAGDNTVAFFGSLASGRDANIRFGDSVNASARIGYLSGALYMYTNGAERLKLNLSGNLGLGVTPSAWSIGKAMEVGFLGTSVFAPSQTVTNLTNNTYYSSGAYRYATTNAAAYYSVNTGLHQWFTAPSGTAGNAISFTQAMTLDASGNLGIGTSSPNLFGSSTIGLTVNGSGGSHIEMLQNGAAHSYLLANANGLRVWTNSANPIVFGTNSTERARIDSSGNLLVGTTTSAGSGLTIVSSKYIWSVGTYNNTTANAANMTVGAAGDFQRSTSALKYKQDIRDLENIDVNVFRAVRYKSKCTNDDQSKDHFGIIADEVHSSGISELVNYSETGEVEGFQYERLTVVLLKAIQELKAEFDAYKASHP